MYRVTCIPQAPAAYSRATRSESRVARVAVAGRTALEMVEKKVVSVAKVAVEDERNFMIEIENLERWHCRY